MDINKHDKHDEICRAYWDIRDRVRQDPEYARMQEALEELTPMYEALLKKLPAMDRELLERYILLRESLNSRTLEWACGRFLFPPA